MAIKNKENSFFIGDLVECISDISSEDGGPRKGEKFTVTAVSTNYIGFPLSRLNANYYPLSTINGKDTNWGNNCFILLERSKTAEILFGNKSR